MYRPLVIVSSFALAALAAPVFAQSTAFTYQGILKNAGQPANGLHDLRFTLFNVASGGAQLVPPQCVDNVQVVGGLFTTTIDFGQQFATTEARFIQIESRADTGLTCATTTGFTILSPRQALTAAPLASHARSAFALDAADGSPANAVFVDNDGNVGIGTTNTTSLLSVGSPTNRGTLNVVGSSTVVPVVTLSDSRASGRQFSLYGGLSGLGSLNIFDQSAAAHRLTIDSTGNVGIGIPSPTSALHIANDNPIITLQDTGVDEFQQSSRISLRNNAGVETGSMGFDASSMPDISIVNSRLGGHILLVPPSSPVEGMVRIGSGLPQDKLDVDGGLRLRLSTASEDLKIYNGSGARIWMMGLSDEFPSNPALRMISPFTGEYQATMQRSPQSGGGMIIADEKNFRAPNPADLTTDIYYCCPEGPEAAMYVRGTAQLVNGRALIALPDHFRNLASEPGMTVQVTPLSGESRGLAVTRKSLNGIEVRELAKGMGNYEFDWRVEAVRAGYENYQVIRPWMRSDPDEGKAWQNRLNWIEERRAHGRP